MDRVTLKELKFDDRNEAISFLKKLWGEKQTECPVCGNLLEMLHRKAKKSNCDWQCKQCNKTYKIIHLLNEVNEILPD